MPDPFADGSQQVLAAARPATRQPDTHEPDFLQQPTTSLARSGSHRPQSGAKEHPREASGSSRGTFSSNRAWFATTPASQPRRALGARGAGVSMRLDVTELEGVRAPAILAARDGSADRRHRTRFRAVAHLSSPLALPPHPSRTRWKSTASIPIGFMSHPDPRDASNLSRLYRSVKPCTKRSSRVVLKTVGAARPRFDGRRRTPGPTARPAPCHPDDRERQGRDNTWGRRRLSYAGMASIDLVSQWR
jgi:hypothetical protein